MALVFVGIVALICAAYWLVRPKKTYLSCWYYEFLSQQEEHNKKMQELDCKAKAFLGEPQTMENIEKLKEITLQQIEIGNQYMKDLEKIMKKNGITY